MEKKLEQLCSIIRSLDEINETFFSELKTLSERNTSLEIRNQALQEKQDEINASVVKFTELIKTNEQKTLELDKRDEGFDDEKARAVQQAEEKVEAEKDKVIQGLKSDITKLNQQLTRLKSDNTTLNTKLTIATSEADTYKQKATTFNNDKISLSAKLNKCEADLKTANGKIASLESDIKKKDTVHAIAITRKDNNINELNESINQLNDKIITLNSEKAELKNKVTELENKKPVDDDGYAADYLKKLCTDKDVMIDALNTKVGELTAGNKTLENNLNESRKCRSEAEKKLEILTKHLYEKDNWKAGAVEGIIEDGLREAEKANKSSVSDNMGLNNDDETFNPKPNK